MIVEFAAVIYKIWDTQYLGKTESFLKRQIVLEETTVGNNGKVYSQLLLCFAIGLDKTKALDDFATGDRVLAKCSIRSNAWEPPDGGETRYFTELNILSLHPSDPDGYGNTESGDNPESIYINPLDADFTEEIAESKKNQEPELFKEDESSDLPF